MSARLADHLPPAALRTRPEPVEGIWSLLRRGWLSHVAFSTPEHLITSSSSVLVVIFEPADGMAAHRHTSGAKNAARAPGFLKGSPTKGNRAWADSGMWPFPAERHLPTPGQRRAASGRPPALLPSPPARMRRTIVSWPTLSYAASPRRARFCTQALRACICLRGQTGKTAQDIGMPIARKFHPGSVCQHAQPALMCKLESVYSRCRSSLLPRPRREWRAHSCGSNIKQIPAPVDEVLPSPWAGSIESRRYEACRDHDTP